MDRGGLVQTCFLPRRLVKAAYSAAEPTSHSVARSRLYREQTRSARLAGQKLGSSHPEKFSKKTESQAADLHFHCFAPNDSSWRRQPGSLDRLQGVSPG